ncbi:MAG: hypothetical protein EOP87_01475 [Verrucomicrobiaceae bacterium]|nr:MAG: hypothetical protein EOP87_01475 [Verrucomicrobiaceae bacterium]
MKHPVKWLIALNILTLMVAMLMFAVCVAATAMTQKTESILRSSIPQAAFEARLEKHIGKPYTKELHDLMVSYLRDGDRFVWKSLGAVRDFSSAFMQTGGIIAIIGMANLFLLWKVKRSYDAMKSGIAT